MTDEPAIRASDAERAQIVERLRDASAEGRLTLEGDVITILALGAFAALDVYVPEGVEVDFRGFALLGHARARGDDPPPRPGTPLVRVFAVSLWAGVDVWRVPLAWARRTLSQVINGIEGVERRELGA